MSWAHASPWRVLMVTARFPPYSGGVETHVREVAPRLVGLGLNVEVLTTDPSGEQPKRELIDGVKVLRIPAYPRNRDYYFAPGILHHLRAGRYDLVHLQGYHNLVAPLTMLAALRARTPYLVSFHSGGSSARLRRLIRGAQRLALRPGFAWSARLIAVSQFELDLFSRSLRLAPSRFALIRNGSSMPPPSTKPNPTKPLVLSVGRLERYKGHHRLVAAWPLVLQRQPSARLRILGVGPYQDELKRQVDRLRLEGNVEIGSIPPGRPQLMSDALGSANLVALLSDYEAHPVALMEAVAVGRPVLVTDSSGLTELVAAGLAKGIPVDASPELIAQAVIQQLRAPLTPGTAALPTWDECASELHDLYRSILQ
jgi:glycosyltransferase involved in cell wall biosynthesis